MIAPNLDPLADPWEKLTGGRRYPRPVGALRSQGRRLLILDTELRPMGIIIRFRWFTLAIGGRKA